MTRPVTLRHVLQRLKGMGTAQNVKVYRRHGVEGPMFGVSFANLNTLQRSIGRNHDLALGLWRTGNHDAQVLATMIADPAKFSARELETWARTLGNYVVADAFSKLVRHTPFVNSKAARWTASRNDFMGQAGWNRVSFLAMSEVSLSEADFSRYIQTIQKRIHTSNNRTRYAMNNALIAIGIRSARLKNAALRAAERIGTVTVDHGQTGCKTPDARQYILKSWNRKLA
jgi:3-methyladenine DNA glycosylase AlkD